MRTQDTPNRAETKFDSASAEAVRGAVRHARSDMTCLATTDPDENIKDVFYSHMRIRNRFGPGYTLQGSLPETASKKSHKRSSSETAQLGDEFARHMAEALSLSSQDETSKRQADDRKTPASKPKPKPKSKRPRGKEPSKKWVKKGTSQETGIDVDEEPRRQ